MKRAALWAVMVSLVFLPAFLQAQSGPAKKPANPAASSPPRGISYIPPKYSPIGRAPEGEEARPSPAAGASSETQSKALGALKSAGEERPRGAKSPLSLAIPAPGGGKLGDIRLQATPSRAKAMFAIPW